MQVFGLIGVLYGGFLLKFTKLGFNMREARTWTQTLFLLLSTAAVPSLTTQALFISSQQRSYNEYDAITRRDFDPIDSYLRHFTASQ